MTPRRLLVLFLGLGFLLTLSAVPTPVLADDGCDRYVLAIDTSDSGDCSDETAPCRTIQFAIDRAIDGDTICIASHPLAGPLTYPETLVITKSVTLDGAWEGMCVDPSDLTCSVWPVPCDPAHVTVDAGGVGRAVTIDGTGMPGLTAPSISCLTITGGDADGLGGDPGGANAGGGIFSRDAAPLVANSVITGNVGCNLCTGNPGIGGGIYLLNAPGSATIRDSVVANNVGDNAAWGRGGGIALRNADARIVGNVIVENRAGASAGDGGGVAVFDGNPLIRDNEIRDNVGGLGVQGQGGGIYAWSGQSLTIARNTVEHNFAINGPGSAGLLSSGGGVYVAGNPTVQVEIVDNDFTDNMASPFGPQRGAGGGLYLSNVVSPSTVVGNRFSENIAGFNHDGGGGGTYLHDSALLYAMNVVTGNVATWSGDEGRGGGLFVVSGTVQVRDNTFTDNYGAYFPGFPSTAQGYGGGIALQATSSTVESNTIARNIATRAEGFGSGGGVYGEGGTLEILNNVIRDNTGATMHDAFGGGVALTGTVALVSRNDLISNTATITEGGQGGGLYTGLGKYRVEGNLVQGNLASPVDIGIGGGLYFQFNTAWVDGNTVVDNVASPGPTLAIGAGVRLAIMDALTLTNNVIAGNGPALEGDGVAILHTPIGEVAHNTVVGNVGGDGVGILVEGNAAVTLTNNLIAQQQVGVLNATPGTASVSADHSLFESNVVDTVAVGSTNEVPGPAGLLPNYRLSPASAALDAGVTLAWVTEDIDREMRPTGVVSDIGADEATCLARTSALDYSTVQAAVDAAVPNGLVMVAAGTCYENVAITKTVTLEGGWQRDFSVRLPDPATRTTIDGMGAGRVISMSAPVGSIAPVIDGLRLTGGDATGLRGSLYTADIGGGVFGRHADATIQGCIVEENVASTNYIGWGGGLGFYQSDVTLEDNVVRDNVASASSNGYGGGIALRFGTCNVMTNTVVDNTASDAAGFGYGGGIWVAQTTAMAMDNVVKGNTASAAGRGWGGGIHGLIPVDVRLEGGVVAGNTASRGSEGYGGGVSVDRGALMLTGVILRRNDAMSFGGGLYVKDDVALTVTATQIVTNSAGMGGGFYLASVDDAQVARSVISDNVGGYGGGGVVMGGTGLLFEDNAVLVNQSDGLAGGLWLSGSADAVLQRSHFLGNRANSDGGALLLLGADRTRVVNTIVGANQAGAGGRGSGVYVEGNGADLVHTTWAQNKGGDGSGIHVGPQSTVRMTNTIIVSHTVGITVAGGSVAETIATLWGAGVWANVADTGGNGSIVTMPANVVGLPAFADPAGGNYRIRGGPATDAGVYAGVADDIDGRSRPIGAGYDIGAYESDVLIYMPVLTRSG